MSLVRPARVACVLLALIAGCAGTAQDASDASADAGVATLGSLSVQQLSTQLASKDFVLVNVHVPREGQIPGTDAHVAYNDPAAIAAYAGSDRSRKVVVYCKSNAMSTQAGQKLVAMGYRSVRYVDGGMGAWQSAGYALEP